MSDFLFVIMVVISSGIGFIVGQYAAFSKAWDLGYGRGFAEGAESQRSPHWVGQKRK